MFKKTKSRDEISTKICLTKKLMLSPGDINPKPQFFSLMYIDRDGKKMHTDIGGYRPDPTDFLKSNVNYQASLKFSYETDEHGIDIPILKRVDIGKFKFVRVR